MHRIALTDNESTDLATILKWVTDHASEEDEPIDFESFKKLVVALGLEKEVL